VSAPKLHSQSVVKVISEYSSYIKEAPSCTNWYSWFWLFHLCRICMTGLMYPSCVKIRTGRVILKHWTVLPRADSWLLILLVPYMNLVTWLAAKVRPDLEY